MDQFMGIIMCHVQGIKFHAEKIHYIPKVYGSVLPWYHRSHIKNNTGSRYTRDTQALNSQKMKLSE